MDKQFFKHYSGLKASSDGEVWIPKSGRNPEHFTYGTIRKDGHRQLYYRRKFYNVHVIVAEVFLNDNQPIDTNVYAVHHINGDPEDNRVDNLSILTHSEHISLHSKGKHLSDASKKKISEANSKSVIGVNKVTGDIVEFKSLTEAWMVLNINIRDICNCCKGRQKSAGGYVWSYS